MMTRKYGLIHEHIRKKLGGKKAGRQAAAGKPEPKKTITVPGMEIDDDGRLKTYTKMFFIPDRGENQRASDIGGLQNFQNPCV